MNSNPYPPGRNLTGPEHPLANAFGVDMDERGNYKARGCDHGLDNLKRDTRTCNLYNVYLDICICMRMHLYIYIYIYIIILSLMQYIEYKIDNFGLKKASSGIGENTLLRIEASSEIEKNT